MANILISNICNLQCPYCFTGDHFQKAEQSSRQPFITLDAFQARLDFLERSGITEARLLGGEPTLHPEFSALIQKIREHKLRVVLFTHGLMSEKVLTCLESIPVQDCFVLMNINAPESELQGKDSRRLERQMTVLRRLGKRAMPGFNIYQADFDATFLLDVVQKSACKPAIRLGLAHACLSGNNAFIHPKQYPFIGEKITILAIQAARYGIRLEFDCGFVPCMFSDKQHELLQQLTPPPLMAWHCNPILDIDIQGEAIHCYPLSAQGSYSVNGKKPITARQLRQQFEADMQPYRQAGIYPECTSCPLKQKGECPGGCLAATIRRFRPAHFSLEVLSATGGDTQSIVV